MSEHSTNHRYPHISDYAFLSDCHSAALVSRNGSIDWCCMPRFDGGSMFARLLDAEKGGYCRVIGDNLQFSRQYVDATLVLKTTIKGPAGTADLYDFFAIVEGGRDQPLNQLIRLFHCTEGHISLGYEILPRFDYGVLAPWMRKDDINCYSAIGGNDGLVIHADTNLERVERQKIRSEFSLTAGQCARLSIRYKNPAVLEHEIQDPINPDEIDKLLEDTKKWWMDWARQMQYHGAEREAVLRSAVVLKGLSTAQTGAIVAAATTSLPERIGGDRNWDYRYSWIRDSVFSARSLAEIGFVSEPDRFRRFIQRSAASSAATLQIMYGIFGERRLTEFEMPELDGFMGSRPVRIGNEAYKQSQWDCYGLMMQLVWKWHERGRSPEDDLWRFLVNIVDTVCEIWQKPDQGLWESRGPAEHYVHSKVMCWAAVHFGIRLAEDCLRQAHLAKWREAREAIRASIFENGIDHERKCFVQAYGCNQVDAALLLIPNTCFVDWKDELMIGTANAIIEDLDYKGFIRRYDTRETEDGVGGGEGIFVACTFWMVECLAMQGRIAEACQYYDRAVSTRNDLGLFAEQFDPTKRELLGNFPQALSHLAHINATLMMHRGDSPIQTKSQLHVQ